MRKPLAILAFVSALALVGCGSVAQSANVSQTTTSVTTTAEPTTEATTEAEELKLIGKKASGSDVFTLDLENKTGKDIVSITIKAETEEKYPENMLEEKDTFAKDEKRKLYYVPKKVSDVVYGKSDKIANLQYSVKLVFADKTEAILHQFPFDDLDLAEIHLEDGVAFIKYTSKLTKEKVDTKGAEEMSEILPDSTEPIHEIDPDANNHIDATYDPEPSYTPAPTQAAEVKTPDTGCGSNFATNPTPDQGCGSGFATNPDQGCGSGFVTNPDQGCGSGFATNPDQGCGSGFVTNPDEGCGSGFVTNN
ncbi:MAG: hypothetical protein K5898_02500 [Ruminococcus sp.]|uniref:hypothetical protein n=1 Tax=Ruminococcus sp. TaxID=41978 RepID=UPI0025E27535|nr:hypothetical protein [Ruminococcus sp.]MCR4794038.1 hypothetical protein [Ruminococcus sp.]